MARNWGSAIIGGGGCTPSVTQTFLDFGDIFNALTAGVDPFGGTIAASNRVTWPTVGPDLETTGIVNIIADGLATPTEGEFSFVGGGIELQLVKDPDGAATVVWDQAESSTAGDGVNFNWLWSSLATGLDFDASALAPGDVLEFRLINNSGFEFAPVHLIIAATNISLQILQVECV